MTDTNARSFWKEAVSIFGLLLTIVTLLVGGGKLLGAVDENTRRIVALEGRADRRDESFADLRERIGSMDAKLDLLIKRTTTER